MKQLASLFIVLALLSGCASYQSKFEVAGNKFSLPKDATFSFLQVSIPSTNGPITLVVSNGVFKMNPANIDAQTAHDVAVINATVQGLGTLSGAAAKAASGAP